MPLIYEYEYEYEYSLDCICAIFPIPPFGPHYRLVFRRRIPGKLTSSPRSTRPGTADGCRTSKPCDSSD